MRVDAAGAPVPGAWIASALRGSWRASPPAVDWDTIPLRHVAPFLLATGAAGLVWRRLRGAGTIDPDAGGELQQAYRLHTLQAALHEGDLARVITGLRAAGVEPLLVKGWAAARFYPEPGLRPYGDLDVCVHPGDHRAAQQVVATVALDGSTVDLHRGCRDLGDRAFDDLRARSRLLPLGDVPVRVLAPEDELRLLCQHLLRHGAWRPLWLVDVCAALESLDARFDWDRFFAGGARAAAWLAAVLALAGELLDARLDHTPLSTAPVVAPRWLATSVLRQWSNSARWPSRTLLVPAILGRPLAALAEVRRRWPDPIQATVRWRGPVSGAPRGLFQLLRSLAAMPTFGRQLIFYALSPAFRRSSTAPGSGVRPAP